MKINRIVPLFLALVIASMSISCGSSPAPADGSNETQTSAPSDTSKEDTSVHDDLPARDFNDETITFLVREEMGYEFEVDGPVDDTHTRIRLVTSWATPETAVEEFLADLALCH